MLWLVVTKQRQTDTGTKMFLNYLHHECVPNVDKLTLLRINCNYVGMSQGLWRTMQTRLIYFLLPPASWHLFNLHNLKAFFKGLQCVPSSKSLHLFSHSVLSDSSVTTWTAALRFLCPWDFRSKKIGVGGQFLLHRIFATQRLNPCLCNGRQVLYH